MCVPYAFLFVIVSIDCYRPEIKSDFDLMLEKRREVSKQNTTTVMTCCVNHVLVTCSPRGLSCVSCIVCHIT